MKKLTTILAALFTILLVSTTAFAAKPITVIVGGAEVYADVDPIIVDGRTMLPARAVFESFGAKVSYVDNEKKVIATKGDTTVTFVIDSNIMTINGEEKEIDVPAMIKDSRTLVPLRACGEAFGYEVTWNPDTRTASVKTPVSLPIESGYDSTVVEKYEYDSNGNNTYFEEQYEDSIYWNKSTYDQNGNQTYYENSDGYWQKSTYDQYGNETYNEDSDGYWEKHDYDQDGNQTYSEDSDGYWYKYAYDQNGNEIYCESSSGTKRKSTYDQNGNLIYVESSDGSWRKYNYDQNGNIVYYETSSGYWEKHTYDQNGVSTHIQYSDGSWAKYTYDQNN